MTMFNSHLDDHQRPNLVTPWKEGTNYINPRLWVYDIQNIINIHALLQLRTGCIFVHIPDSNQSGKRSSISDDEICIDLWWSLLLSNIIYVVNYVRKWSHILLLCIIKK